MATYILSFTVFALALCGLGVGVLAGRRGIAGTCGGLNNPDGPECGACGHSASDETQCPRRVAQ